ncbi:MAG: ABC transporter permease, partial [Gemmatimonadales bacterium]|nr:ABC transporter permease [Gemmatimonadales bacterium]
NDLIGARADQIITGTAITLASVGLTGTIYRSAFGAAGPTLSIPTFNAVEVAALTGVAWLLVPVVWWFLFRSWWGLALRAAGESAEAARASGVPVTRVRVAALLAGGALGGLAGATLVLAQTGTFAEKMTAGRGFIAIAIVVLGRWHPAGVLVAALLFGAASALQFGFQAMGLAVPYQLFLVMPYLLALLALAGAVGESRAPAGLAKP